MEINWTNNDRTLIAHVDLCVLLYLYSIKADLWNRRPFCGNYWYIQSKL